MGFLLWEEGSGKPQYQRIGGLITMGLGMVETLAGAIDRMTLRELDLDRVVKIPTGEVGAADFDLSDQTRDWLYDSGYDAAKKFLLRWNFDEHKQKRARTPA